VYCQPRITTLVFESYRKRDVYGLCGQLQKWHQLYNSTQAKTHPFGTGTRMAWDGKEVVQTVGVTRAIEQMTEPYRVEIPRVLDPEARSFNQSEVPADMDRTWLIDRVNVSQMPLLSDKELYMMRTHIQESTPYGIITEALSCGPPFPVFQRRISGGTLRVAFFSQSGILVGRLRSRRQFEHAYL